MGPPDEDRLYEAALDLVSKAASLELQKIPLVPLRASKVKGAQPSILWGYRPRGAFHAAFLQWFFLHLASAGPAVCAAKGCDEAVLPPRTKFCSDKCQRRSLIADYRARQAMARLLHDDGQTLEDIASSIKDHFGMERPPETDTVRAWIAKGHGREGTK
jgi:hypothetical protein